MAKEKVLITGGSGMIGTRLTTLLLQEGYQVFHLGRNPVSRSGVKTYRWDLSRKYLESGALDGVDHLIHLAGENIGGGRWTTERKKNILNSRTRTLDFLFEQCNAKGAYPRTVVSAGGSAYYGQITSDHIFRESDDAGSDFMAEVCVKWEEAARAFNTHSRTVILRTPLVLDANEGALPRIAFPAQFGLGAYFGNGKQWVPWIHLDDLCQLYLHALRTPSMTGAFHAVANEQTSMKTFVKEVARAQKSRAWLPGLPKWMAYVLFGEMSVLVTEGSRLSTEKLLATGFSCRQNDVRKALNDLYSQR